MHQEARETGPTIGSRSAKACTLAKVDFQFRDIRGKAATDTGDLAHSQKLLAHKNRDMTEHYVKARMESELSRCARHNFKQKKTRRSGLLECVYAALCRGGSSFLIFSAFAFSARKISWMAPGTNLAITSRISG